MFGNLLFDERHFFLFQFNFLPCNLKVVLLFISNKNSATSFYFHNINAVPFQFGAPLVHVANVLNNARTVTRWRHGQRSRAVPEVRITAPCPTSVSDLDVLHQVSLLSFWAW